MKNLNESKYVAYMKMIMNAQRGRIPDELNKCEIM